MENDILAATSDLLAIGYYETATNVLLAIVLGFILALVYKNTHKGLSYSQSFTHTVLLVTVIVAIVMMVIGGSLSRAFALVGALSIIRFRTVVKDTRDTSFVFAGLAIGMASGTSNYFLAVLATFVVSVLAIALFKFNFAALYKSEFILRFRFDQAFDSRHYLQCIQDYSKRSNMLHIEPSPDGNLLKLTYDITLKEGQEAEQLSQKLARSEGISEVVLIASKNDVDY
ncbi:MAG: DUF4956 domain-containing protein [Pseudomonadales bacterium]|nr:DUF4956 domain-containing protein [Pseudomonadales bacterium]